MHKNKLILFIIVLAVVTLFFVSGIHEYFSLDYFRSQQDAINQYRADHPVKTGVIFFIIYILITGISLPGAAILTLIGGAIFGLLWGIVLVSFASVIGATIAFLISRYILQDYIQKKFAKQLVTINRGIEQDGAYYLFSLRMIPIFPFFIINLVMGITRMKVLTFALVSQVGMLAGTAVYVNAGVQLSRLESIRGILSVDIAIAFSLLGLFPLLAKLIVSHISARRLYKKYKKPEKYDRNLVVIGAGSAGLVSAYIAATVRAKVSLIEKHKMGGDCLNTGCVPSKSLIRTARFIRDTQRCESLGIRKAEIEFEFADVMARVQRIINRIEPHDSKERYENLGVECLQGEAKIVSPWQVDINGKSLTTKNMVIATGAQPFIPPIDGIENAPFYTSDTIWQLRDKPADLVVLGGGPIGCELSQAFARLGCQVTLVEMLPRLLIREDPEIAKYIEDKFSEEKINLLLEHSAVRIIKDHDNNYLICHHQGQEVRTRFDALLVAVGRKANTQGYGLEELGIRMNENGTIAVNQFMQTNYPNIYACGDVAGPYQFTHIASHQAWYAAVNALFGQLKKFRIDYSVIPWATFTDPEIARVGLNEQDANAQHIEYEVTRFHIDDLDRAITDEDAHGLVKLLTVPHSDKILGATIVGAHAGELITEYISAMKNNIGLNRILGTIHIYPTFSEANKYAAGNWKKNHKPEKILNWLQKYHQWRLG